MEFLKRNIGLCLFLVAAAVIFAVLAFLGGIQQRQLAGKRLKLAELVSEMDRLRQSKLAISAENLAVATQNQKVATHAFQTFQGTLHAKYGFPEERMLGTLRTKNEVAAGLTYLDGELKKRGIKLGENWGDFSLGAVRTEAIPSETEVPLLMKQYRIVEAVANLVLRNQGIAQLNRVAQLSPNLQPLPGQLHDTTPLEIKVMGSYPGVALFVNQLQGDANRAFFVLRSLDLQAVDQAANNTLPEFKPPVKEDARPRPGSSPQPPRPAARKTSGALGPEDAGTGTRLLELSKEERVVFNPHEVSATLVVDYIEFKKPAEER
ncbi:MAG: Amuc_1100 family pilus-like protein [Lentisphaeria bacterium]|jgi:Tfp pilus assembly protein PilO